MPSVRKFAAKLGVSAFTVTGSYDRLCARNLVASRPGSGYYVVGATDRRDLPEADALVMPPSDPIGFALHCLDASGASLRSGSGFLPESWLSDVVPATLVTRVAKGRGALLASSPVQGSRALRQQLSDGLRARGIPATADRIVTTVGATHALDLVLRSLFRPGDMVVVENPGYVFYAAQARALDLRVEAVARTADGPDLDRLRELVERHHAKAFITQTLLHNPTGGSTSAAKCHRLLALAERHGLAIIEDDVYGDIAARGATRLAQLDELRHVYYISSYSKLLSPALRVGFAALPAAAIDRVVGQKVLGVLGTPGLTEAIVAAVLDSGRYQRHVLRLRSKLALFRQRASRGLLEAGVELDSAESDGLFLWGRLPGAVNIDALVRGALDEGILLAKGQLFSADGGFGAYLRFNVAHSADPRLPAFLARAIAGSANPATVRHLRPVP
jgi:DNA-binding transcriptional MocR family regulator